VGVDRQAPPRVEGAGSPGAGLEVVPGAAGQVAKLAFEGVIGLEDRLGGKPGKRVGIDGGTPESDSPRL